MDIEQSNKTDWEERDRQQAIWFQVMLDRDKFAKERGELNGRYIQEMVMDGYGYYEIIKANRKTVRIRFIENIGHDDYEFPYFGREAIIDRVYVDQSIANRDSIERQQEAFEKQRQSA